MDDPGDWAKRPRMASGFQEGGPPLQARMDPGIYQGDPSLYQADPTLYQGDPSLYQQDPSLYQGTLPPYAQQAAPGAYQEAPPPPFLQESRGQDYNQTYLQPPVTSQSYLPPPPGSGQSFLPPPASGQGFGGLVQPAVQEFRVPAVGGGAPPRTSGSVGLNPADCNIDFDVHPDGLGGSALSSGGFGYCWSGARGTLGLLPSLDPPDNGADRVRYCFGCLITENQPVELTDTPPEQRHLLRVGLSRGDTDVGSLGELPSSFGFGGTGKASTAGHFTDFGEPFGVGDTILCVLELFWPLPPPALAHLPRPPPLLRVGFTKNGNWLGFAFENPIVQLAEDLRPGASECEAAYYPHVLLKNVAVRMQFGLADGLQPPRDCLPWDEIPRPDAWGGRVGLPPLGVDGPPVVPMGSCEVVMMVGIPGSGKTTWAERMQKEEPAKRYIVLGTDLAIDQMKVPGLTRKRSYAQRFGNLMPRATEIFNALLERAARIPRNYILDQTNVYFSARRRKLRPFTAFKKIAMVVVCTPEEQKRRAEKRTEEMGKEVPEEAVNEMKANFVVPQLPPHAHQSKEGFDEIRFVELPEHDAVRVVEEEARMAKNALVSASKPPPLASAAASPVSGVGGAHNNQARPGAPATRFANGSPGPQPGPPPEGAPLLEAPRPAQNGILPPPVIDMKAHMGILPHPHMGLLTYPHMGLLAHRVVVDNPAHMGILRHPAEAMHRGPAAGGPSPQQARGKDSALGPRPLLDGGLAPDYDGRPPPRERFEGGGGGLLPFAAPPLPLYPMQGPEHMHMGGGGHMLPPPPHMPHGGGDMRAEGLLPRGHPHQQPSPFRDGGMLPLAGGGGIMAHAPAHVPPGGVGMMSHAPPVGHVPPPAHQQQYGGYGQQPPMGQVPFGAPGFGAEFGAGGGGYIAGGDPMWQEGYGNMEHAYNQQQMWNQGGGREEMAGGMGYFQGQAEVQQPQYEDPRASMGELQPHGYHPAQGQQY